MVNNLHDALRSACAEVGIIFRDVPADGRWHETDVDGDRRGLGNGRIKLFPDGAGGIVCNWKGETRPFFADDDSALTEAERAERDRKRRDLIRQTQQEETRRRAEAARKAMAIWEAAQSVDVHPYLTRKGVKATPALREIFTDQAAAILGYRPQANGEPLTGRLLVAPIEIGGRISTAELIDEAGRKAAIAGGAKAGGYWAAQPLPDGQGDGLTLLIGEGVATVLSATEATGYPGIAALSCGNLSKVAGTMCERYSAARLVILADLGNGQRDAEEAARSVGGWLALPDFGPNRPDGATDFNDMAARCGLEAVRHCIEATWAETAAVTSETDVTDVTDVQPSSDAAFPVTAAETPDVTDVTTPSVPEIERPCFRVFDTWTDLRESESRLRPGVWFFGIKKTDKSSLTQQWICSPIHVTAVTFDGQENNFGRLLRLLNTLGRWREWAMPMELLRGSGEELRGELLAMGASIDPNAHRLLGQYLQALTPKRRVRCALQVGWCGNVFVLPDAVIGSNAADVIFQSGERGCDEYTKAGTLRGWQDEVAARAVGNPLLILALAGAFTGPLLARCNAEGGGIHFFGDSSTGKTTAIEVACSTWGGPNFRRSWRATANGMEGAAALFNDGLLGLDEISECDPREVGAIVYALGNGRGKQRASRTGTARGVTRWRCFVLSSGERTISTTMAEGGYRTKAGQSVRLLDIPAARQFGAWDELHGLPSGTTFSDALKRAAVTHYGHAGRAFLEKLTRDPRDFCEYLERLKTLPEFSLDGSEGQDKRAAGRFALLALAGEVATEYGITEWPEGIAIHAAAEGLKAWRAWRGRGNDERRQILERIAGFIERHGDSRFSDANNHAGETATVRDRAGWWREEQDGRVYLFNAEGLREALKGFDFKRALDTLQEAEALPKPDASGERAKPQRIGGRLVRLYPILADRLSGDHGA